MALHLITGYAGQEHITSADQGAYNIATFGNGNFVLDRGRKFAYSVLSNNSISIADGEAMMQGRYSKMPSGTSEEVVIENGTQGKYRNDLICIRYEKSAADATESTSFVVLKGTETTSTPSDPSYITGNITDGTDTKLDFPLYRVYLNGINIDTVTPLFSVKESMVKYMDEYQMPNATTSSKGAVQIGDNINVNNGVISLPTATSTQKGGVKIGSGISVDANGTISAQQYSLPTASASTKGGVKVGSGLQISNDVLKIANDLFYTASVTITLTSAETIGAKQFKTFNTAVPKKEGYTPLFANMNGFSPFYSSDTGSAFIFNSYISGVLYVQMYNDTASSITVNTLYGYITYIKN